MNPRHRRPEQLTLGFLTLGAAPAPMDVIDAAAKAGFAAAGLRISGRHPGDPWPSVDGDPLAFETLRAHAQACGVRLSSASGFYITPATQAAHLRANVEAARRLGAPLIVQGCFDQDLGRVAALLPDYAQAARAAGIRIGIEFLPMRAVRNLAMALDLIAAAGQPDDIGLVIDTLHLARSGGAAATLRGLDPARVCLVQICDAPAQAASSLFDEAMTGRLYPGDGELALASFLAALPADCEVECETPVAADAALALAERARRSAAKAAAFFDAHFGA